jgi:hypothetical protein
VETDALIQKLTDDARPVRPLARPWLRALLWLAISAPPVFLVVWWHGLQGKAGMAATADLRMTIEWLAIFATAVTAAIAAFSSSVPGASRRWLWVPVVPLAIWLLTVGQGCVEDYQAMGAAAFALRPDSECYVPTVLAGIIPIAAILTMLRRGAPLVPRTTLALAGLAVAAVVNLAMLLFHVGDISFMVLIWHVGVVAVFAGLAGWAGPRLLTWRYVSAAGTP